MGENPLEYEERRSALFWFETTDDEDFILSPRDTLYDDESIFEYDTDSDHWVLDEYGSDMTSDYQVGSLEPGDTHTETLWVVTPYNANPPEETPEELRFTGEFTVSETDVNGLEEGEDESWEFTLVRKEDDQFHIAERLLVIYRGFQQSRFFTSRPVPPCSVMLRNVPHSSA
ncbi:uncharacterized protein Nmag_1903 [Natrialba magadii ATCC 43099]|uniref:Uncharacterized protein n=1 Tax=Natrialba magadii (strain ATCC 43099 / DSM 3394 / CCM 3739 / CIP 104546 / IAM 13178 / JCM 8861 / NBRC 102185 / NCIMB 2190 / MS3) TaxID=547559 RepID=D3SV66_NATMM|nr:hypothetical protein [Natrialba magadii]ADD05474.1 uncharacterized protein Nmag_1903 [Natrialba magadii ATCC 43099]ELY29219.1 hypothetical protein C500_10885 [Natrialba magadii ATCC 43099]